MLYRSQYGCYESLVVSGYQTIFTKDITDSNIDQHFDSIIAILNDGIETEEVQRMKIHVVFTDGVELNLTIFDYMFNLMFWILTVAAGDPITSLELFFLKDMKKSDIKKYVDNVFINRNRTKIFFNTLNIIIDRCIGRFRDLRNYQQFLANTVCMEDTIDLMKQFPEFRQSIYTSVSDQPIEDVKDIGMKQAFVQIDHIKNSNHSLRDSFRTGEGVNPKQFKEVNVNIGTKPDGQGSVFPHIIDRSFINGGLDSIEALYEESSVGRVAQILQKRNVGKSGDFARKLGLNNQDTRLHTDPYYICNTKNLIPITIRNTTMLRMYNMRYYREKRNGVDKLLDYQKDTHLVGKTVWMRSPATCASAAAGYGICYRCYGDLAYVNRDINIGQIAAELLSSIYTQILLSAKHLLESMVIKMVWSEGFDQVFDILLNTIVLKDNMNYHGMKMIFNRANMYNDNEYDDMIFSDYTTSFNVRFPNDTEIEIRTQEFDNIYISPELMDIINANTDTDSDIVELDIAKLSKLPSLFAVEIKNNELSNTMNRIKNLINNKGELRKHDLPDLIDTFVNTNISGGITLNAVHFEVLIMNQIRNAEDIIEVPDWSKTDEVCQILTLDDALANHRSLSVRLQHNNQQGMTKTLTNPRLRDLTKPSTMDMYFMEKPQDFLSNRDHISDDFRSDTDIEDNRIRPIYFVDKNGNRIPDPAEK